MKENIIWIASYPKSGNTLIRSFLAAYFFTNNGILNDFSYLRNIPPFNSYNNYKDIKNFPKINYFKENPESISKYWRLNQDLISRKLGKNVIFYKTHNAQIKHENNYFTEKKVTKCFIYIVRDPRSVIYSSLHHYGFKNIDEAVEVITSDKWLSYATEKPNLLPEFILSWKTHFLSWQNFYAKNKNIGIILRFEDLVEKPNKFFLLLIEFLSKNLNFKINTNKLTNSINSVNFNELSKLEKKIGFNEKGKNSESFFRKGEIREWENKINSKNLKKIDEAFFEQLKFLNYD